jgi:glycosyltransferase involved in cell wall biosynthesis
MPKVLLEAAVAGRAVVATDVTVCREAVEPGVTGDLVPVRDSSALAKALLSLIKDDQLRKSYGIKGLVRAKTMFSVESVISQTLNIYQGVLGYE